MTITVSDFPIPDSTYATNGVRFDRFAALSLLALHLQLVTNDANILKADRKRGFIFLRDDSIPKPRPATQLAWERICRLGRPDSRSFLVPFLPALREEDETGQAISERGSHVGSLSRRNPNHRRETVASAELGSFEAIVWGDVYLGRIQKDHIGIQHSALVGVVDRSNVVESLVLPRADIDGASAQESIRTRMEFLAQYGIVATRDFCRTGLIPRINRLLFQFLRQEDASRWADSYRDTYFHIRRDADSINADYRELVESLQVKLVESEEAEPEKVEKSSRVRQDFGDLML